MTWWGWLILATVIIMAALAASSIRFQVYYSRLKDNDRFFVYIRAVFGLVKYRYEVPILAFKGLAQGIEIKNEHVNEHGDKLIAENSDNIDKEKVQTSLRKFREMIQSTFRLKDWFADTLTHVKCTELVWKTRLGLGEAPETAIATGLVWTLKSSALGYLFNHIKRNTKPKVQVIPLYNQVHFSTELSCIAQIRLGQAMVAGLLLLVRILKVKGGVKAWQNILFKAS